MGLFTKLKIIEEKTNELLQPRQDGTLFDRKMMMGDNNIQIETGWYFSNKFLRKILKNRIFVLKDVKKKPTVLF